MHLRVVLALSATLALTACDVEPISPNDLGSTAQPVTTANQLTYNQLTYNQLTYNGLASAEAVKASLVANPLTAAAIDDDVRSALLSDAGARAVFKKIYSCALPEGRELTVSKWRPLPYWDLRTGKQRVRWVKTVYSFEGQLGLASEWETGACDGTCQGWVSSCVAARLNATGASVPVSLRGAHPLISAADASETSEFVYQEAGFAGNIFAPGRPQLFVCLGDAVVDGTIGEGAFGYLGYRLCATSDADCGVERLEPCSDYCRENTGWYEGCKVPPGLPGFGSLPRPTSLSQVITTYLDADRVH